ncbi:hypothetical protein [Alkaliphilus serpentinus]|uniref:Uncharacterized protein n=1 Tax=Alkaliphilus serpentinus TaxID=1482731 RepID=A0A833HNU2_9FIRM|nr:hypothetical protein [Alkaliphilus serpentinus]KAB3530019.1 hypothetical protein F8153_07940 [Alkaliphilus serpentinus]
MSEINIESLFGGNSFWLIFIVIILLLGQPSGFKPGFKSDCKGKDNSILLIILVLILFSSGGKCGKGGKGCKF